MHKKLPVIEHNPWSPSKANLAAQCGLAFKLRYIDKVPSETRGSAAKVGVAVHLAQETLLQGGTASAAIDTAISFHKEELTESEQETVRTFTHSIDSFKKKLDRFRESHKVTDLFLEKKWACTVNYTACSYDATDTAIVRGIVDLGLCLVNGYVIIIDHKSGRVRPAQYYRTQLDFYSIMALAQYPDAKGVQCALNYLAADKVVWNAPIRSDYIRKMLQPWLLDYLAARTKNAANPVPRTGVHCRWCDYKKLCPAWGSDEGRTVTSGASERTSAST